MKALAITILATISCLGLGAQTDISVDEFGTMIAKYGKKLQIVDVRTPSEFNQGHIEEAKNIDFRSENFKETAAKELKKKNAVIIVYCRSGVRSAAAAKQLTEMSYKKIYNLKGGYIAWTKTKK